MTVRVNDQGQIGFSNDEGQAFFPDMILVDENGLRYSAQVEIPTTVNLVTAQWWAFYNISMVFIPLGYLALARSLAKQTGYPENRLMAYISPAVSSENI